MITTGKKQIFKAAKFEPLKTQNFEATKLNGFTVSLKLTWDIKNINLVC